MSATNPLPSSDPVSEKRPYEPSMEEILASIRRIIADDQSLPGRIAMPEPEAAAPVPQAPAETPPSVSVLHPHRVIPPEVAPVPQYPAEAQPVEAPPPVEAGPAHGAIAAPQFAMPEGPATELQPAHTPEPVAPPTAVVEPEPVQHLAPEPEPAQSPYVAELPPELEDEPLYDTPIEPAPVHEAQVHEAPAHDDRAPAALFSAATDSAVSSAFNMLAASRLADNSDELMTLAREMIRPLLRAWIDDNLPGMVERMVRAEIERVARGGR